MTEVRVPKTLDEAYEIAAKSKPALDAFGQELADS